MYAKGKQASKPSPAPLTCYRYLQSPEIAAINALFSVCSSQDTSIYLYNDHQEVHNNSVMYPHPRPQHNIITVIHTGYRKNVHDGGFQEGGIGGRQGDHSSGHRTGLRAHTEKRLSKVRRAGGWFDGWVSHESLVSTATTWLASCSFVIFESRLKLFVLQ